jgi:tight adherence protein C
MGNVLVAATVMEMLVPAAVFVAVAALAWWLVDLFTGASPRAEERLDELKNPIVRRRGEELVNTKKKGQMSRVLAKAAPALSRPLQPKTGEEMSKLKLRLVQGGFRQESHPSIFLGLKFAGLVFGLFVGGGAVLFTSGITQGSLMKAGMIGGLFFYLPDIILWLITKQRKDAIFLGLPDALDLMVVCVEAGLGLDQAMRKVSDEMKRTCRIVSEEFALCNFQLQMGRPRNDVLHELGSRSGVDDLRSLAAILIQADKFGSSIAQALRVQSDAMRTRRRQLAEEKAAKTAVKLIFPLVLFIFPAIFVVLVGPAAITMVNEMFPAMSGQK